MHDRNIFKLNPPNYEELARKYHEFRVRCFIGAGGKVCVNFSDLEAVRVLSQILLLEYFQLDIQLPIGHLVPRVPQRLNYILLLEDLINKNSLDNSSILGIDIGTGASCIFPLLGARLNNCWSFVATEVDTNSIDCARQNIGRNSLEERIWVEQSKQDSFLKEVISKELYRDKLFTFSMCNPPFFDPDEASQKFTVDSVGNSMTNLLGNNNSPPTKCPPRSATTATRTELVYTGGESAFIMKILEESAELSENIWYELFVFWFFHIDGRKNVKFETAQKGVKQKKNSVVCSFIMPRENYEMGKEKTVKKKHSIFSNLGFGLDVFK